MKDLLIFFLVVVFVLLTSCSRAGSIEPEPNAPNELSSHTITAAIVATPTPNAGFRPLTDLPKGCWSSYSGDFIWIGEHQLRVSTDRKARVSFKVVEPSDSFQGSIYELLDRPEHYFFQKYVRFSTRKVKEGYDELFLETNTSKDFSHPEGYGRWVRQGCKGIMSVGE